MPRPTSLDKYRAALAGTGFDGIETIDPPVFYGGAPVTTVWVWSTELLNAQYADVTANGAYHRDGGVVGLKAVFDGDGKFIYSAHLVFRVGGRYFENEPSGYIYWIGQAGRQYKSAAKTLKAAVEDIRRYSPTAIARRKALAEEEAEANRLAREASQARVKAIKPDVRQAVWNVSHERDRALSDYVGALKAVAHKAEELIGRAESGYVYDSDTAHLTRMAADAAAAGGKLMALTMVVNSDFAPLFEGSPWSDD